MPFTKSIFAVAISTAMLAGCVTTSETAPQTATVSKAAIIDTYSDIAQATYEDSLVSAKTLQAAVNALLAAPSEATLANAREAWLAARVPYQQSEAYRFGNAIVDDWEGKVNAWPLDEGLIDYVAGEYGEDSDENPFYTANIIANSAPVIGGTMVDARVINKQLLGEVLHEAGEVESNVATGYHAIEFLLWGQDLNGNNPGAGNRPATDFSLSNCTGGNCDRRRDYLSAATELLIDDLADMTSYWGENGAARMELAAKDGETAIATILTGMGSLAYGELAGERTKLGLMLHDPEEEHDCFSDNTHNSHYYDAKGIKNVYLGEYTRIDGSVVKGPSLSALVAQASPALDAEMRGKLEATEVAMQAMVDAAEQGNTFDVLIGAGNVKGNQLVQNAVDALVDETDSIEAIIAELNLDYIELEGSDSLDNPSAVEL